MKVQRKSHLAKGKRSFHGPFKFHTEISFSKTTLPTFVYLGNVRHPESPFKERPIQCCKEFGFENREATCSAHPSAIAAKKHTRATTRVPLKKKARTTVKFRLLRLLPARSATDIARPSSTHANTQLNFAPQGRPYYYRGKTKRLKVNIDLYT